MLVMKIYIREDKAHAVDHALAADQPSSKSTPFLLPALWR